MSVDTVANALLTSLTTDLTVTIPNIDLTAALLQVPTTLTNEMYQPISGPENADLTTRTVGGTGIFDALMASTSAHLKAEFDKGRITGAEYTKAYIELTQIAMQSAVQFALGKSQAFWQAQQAQIAAISGRVQLELNKVSLAKEHIEAQTSEANYALAKIQLSTASIQYDTANYNLTNMLPAQLAMVNSEKTGRDNDNAISAYNLANILPEQLAQAVAQVALLGSQKTGQDDQNAILAYNLSSVLPAQVALSTAQASLTTAQTALAGAQQTVATKQALLLSEQTEAQRAQTLDTRSDGLTVTGSVGKQKALYAQQITSYQRDAEVKAAKLFTDSWITQKTVDEALVAPTGFTNTSLDTILTVLKTNNGF